MGPADDTTHATALKAIGATSFAMIPVTFDQEDSPLGCLDQCGPTSYASGAFTVPDTGPYAAFYLDMEGGGVPSHSGRGWTVWASHPEWQALLLGESYFGVRERNIKRAMNLGFDGVIFLVNGDLDPSSFDAMAWQMEGINALALAYRERYPDAPLGLLLSPGACHPGAWQLGGLEHFDLLVLDGPSLTYTEETDYEESMWASHFQALVPHIESFRYDGTVVAALDWADNPSLFRTGQNALFQAAGDRVLDLGISWYLGDPDGGLDTASFELVASPSYSNSTGPIPLNTGSGLSATGGEWDWEDALPVEAAEDRSGLGLFWIDSNDEYSDVQTGNATFELAWDPSICPTGDCVYNIYLQLREDDPSTNFFWDASDGSFDRQIAAPNITYGIATSSQGPEIDLSADPNLDTVLPSTDQLMILIPNVQPARSTYTRRGGTRDQAAYELTCHVAGLPSGDYQLYAAVRAETADILTVVPPFRRGPNSGLEETNSRILNLAMQRGAWTFLEDARIRVKDMTAEDFTLEVQIPQAYLPVELFTSLDGQSYTGIENDDVSGADLKFDLTAGCNMALQMSSQRWIPANDSAVWEEAPASSVISKICSTIDGNDLHSVKIDRELVGSLRPVLDTANYTWDDPTLPLGSSVTLTMVHNALGLRTRIPAGVGHRSSGVRMLLPSPAMPELPAPIATCIDLMNSSAQVDAVVPQHPLHASCELVSYDTSTGDLLTVGTTGSLTLRVENLYAGVSAPVQLHWRLGSVVSDPTTVLCHTTLGGWPPTWNGGPGLRVATIPDGGVAILELNMAVSAIPPTHYLIYVATDVISSPFDSIPTEIYPQISSGTTDLIYYYDSLPVGVQSHIAIRACDSLGNCDNNDQIHSLLRTSILAMDGKFLDWDFLSPSSDRAGPYPCHLGRLYPDQSVWPSADPPISPVLFLDSITWIQYDNDLALRFEQGDGAKTAAKIPELELDISDWHGVIYFDTGSGPNAGYGMSDYMVATYAVEFSLGSSTGRLLRFSGWNRIIYDWTLAWDEVGEVTLARSELADTGGEFWNIDFEMIVSITNDVVPFSVSSDEYRVQTVLSDGVSYYVYPPADTGGITFPLVSGLPDSEYPLRADGNITKWNNWLSAGDDIIGTTPVYTSLSESAAEGDWDINIPEEAKLLRMYLKHDDEDTEFILIRLDLTTKPDFDANVYSVAIGPEPGLPTAAYHPLASLEGYTGFTGLTAPYLIMNGVLYSYEGSTSNLWAWSDPLAYYGHVKWRVGECNTVDGAKSFIEYQVRRSAIKWGTGLESYNLGILGLAGAKDNPDLRVYAPAEGAPVSYPAAVATRIKLLDMEADAIVAAESRAAGRPCFPISYTRLDGGLDNEGDTPLVETVWVSITPEELRVSVELSLPAAEAALYDVEYFIGARRDSFELPSYFRESDGLRITHYYTNSKLLEYAYDEASSSVWSFAATTLPIGDEGPVQYRQSGFQQHVEFKVSLAALGLTNHSQCFVDLVERYGGEANIDWDTAAQAPPQTCFDLATSGPHTMAVVVRVTLKAEGTKVADFPSQAGGIQLPIPRPPPAHTRTAASKSSAPFLGDILALDGTIAPWDEVDELSNGADANDVQLPISFTSSTHNSAQGYAFTTEGTRVPLSAAQSGIRIDTVRACRYGPQIAFRLDLEDGYEVDFVENEYFILIDSGKGSRTAPSRYTGFEALEADFLLSATQLFARPQPGAALATGDTAAGRSSADWVWESVTPVVWARVNGSVLEARFPVTALGYEAVYRPLFAKYVQALGVFIHTDTQTRRYVPSVKTTMVLRVTPLHPYAQLALGAIVGSFVLTVVLGCFCWGRNKRKRQGAVLSRRRRDLLVTPDAAAVDDEWSDGEDDESDPVL